MRIACLWDRTTVSDACWRWARPGGPKPWSALEHPSHSRRLSFALRGAAGPSESFFAQAGRRITLALAAAQLERAAREDAFVASPRAGRTAADPRARTNWGFHSGSPPPLAAGGQNSVFEAVEFCSGQFCNG